MVYLHNLVFSEYIKIIFLKYSIDMCEKKEYLYLSYINFMLMNAKFVYEFDDFYNTF